MSLGTDVNPPPVTRIESETCLQRRGQPYPPMGLFGSYLVYQQLLVRLSRLSFMSQTQIFGHLQAAAAATEQVPSERDAQVRTRL